MSHHAHSQYGHEAYYEVDSNRPDESQPYADEGIEECTLDEGSVEENIPDEGLHSRPDEHAAERGTEHVDEHEELEYLRPQED